MELRVESAEGTSLPPGCYVGVRIGDVLKQGRYEPQRCYHFPQVDRRRTAKIDIYQHVGSCVVTVDPEAKSTHEVKVEGLDPSFQSMRLKVNVQSKTNDNSKEQREARTKVLKTQAKDYLAKHNIEERLSEAVKALLKEQPADPTDFLCRQLRGVLDEAKLLPSPTHAQEAPVPAAPKTEDLLVLRQQACDVLLKASNNGNLAAVLAEVKNEDQKDTGKAAPIVSKDVPPPVFLPAPSFVQHKPYALSYSLAYGPAFSHLNLPNGLLLI